MDTPIVDFLRRFTAENKARFHMPGHKGIGPLGFESWDITEVNGADALYEASGVIARSEENATALFSSQRTLYSTEGSSQSIRAMLHLLLANRPEGASRTVLAARNAHKAFVYAAALLDFDIHWLWDEENASVCSCTVTADMLEKALDEMPELPAAVYITSPNYLGHMADISALAEVCHRYGTYLAVDNAHGAYLHFLPESLHPLDLGADICCDSAHKTLPVLTGGAYLHIGSALPACFAEKAKSAMALFGSTSPSYLTMASLDACNGYLADGYREKLSFFMQNVECLKTALRKSGWRLEDSDPLRLCLNTGEAKKLYSFLHEQGIEAEYSDNDYLVFMFTPENSRLELDLLYKALSSVEIIEASGVSFAAPIAEQLISVREAVMAKSEIISVDNALGRVCASPLVSCPPAIPIVVSGERITAQAIELLHYYKIEEIEVVARA